jgi:hypothetical protein
MASSSSSSPEITPADYTDSQPRFSYKDATQQEVLDDLSRFYIPLLSFDYGYLCFFVQQPIYSESSRGRTSLGTRLFSSGTSVRNSQWFGINLISKYAGIGFMKTSFANKTPNFLLCR